MAATLVGAQSDTAEGGEGIGREERRALHQWRTFHWLTVSGESHGKGAPDGSMKRNHLTIHPPTNTIQVASRPFPKHVPATRGEVGLGAVAALIPSPSTKDIVLGLFET